MSKTILETLYDYIQNKYGNASYRFIPSLGDEGIMSRPDNGPSLDITNTMFNHLLENSNGKTAEEVFDELIKQTQDQDDSDHSDPYYKTGESEIYDNGFNEWMDKQYGTDLANTAKDIIANRGPTGIANPSDYMSIVQEDTDNDGDIDKVSIEEHDEED